MAAVAMRRSIVISAAMVSALFLLALSIALLLGAAHYASWWLA